MQKSLEWEGFLPDTGAAEHFTAGFRQFVALKRHNPELTLDQSRAGEARVRFGQGNVVISLGTAVIPTPIGTITFHIMETDIPFLICLKDMDKLHAYYNNVRNEIVCEDGKRIPVERKRGYPWFYMDLAGPGITFLTEPEIPGAFLTERELRRIHRRFGHPSIDKLWKLLQRAGEDANLETIQIINKICHFCQKKGKTPQRFKFALKENIDFNYEVIINVVYLDGRPIFHTIDASILYQAARFLTDMSAKKTWETLK